MCGLVGVAGDATKQTMDVFRDLLVMDSLRGAHSTGVYARPAHYTVLTESVLAKEVGNPFEFFKSEAWRKELHLPRWSLMIGHNRFATTGEINKSNAHPFSIGSITGAHNGTLRNQMLLPDAALFEVDSENIFHSIDKLGIKATAKLLCGAYALTYWDDDSKRLTWLRNAERPFHFCLSENGKTLFWASEKEMLQCALSRNKMKHTPIESLPIHTVYEWKIPEKWQDTFDKPHTYAIEPFTYPKPQAVHHNHHMSSAFGQPLRDRARQLLNKDLIIDPLMVVTTPSGQYLECDIQDSYPDISIRWYLKPEDDAEMLKDAGPYVARIKTVQLRPNEAWGVVNRRSIKPYIEPPAQAKRYPVYNGEMVDEKTFDHRTRHGCSWCSDNVFTIDAHDIVWEGHNEFYCPTCVSIRSMYRYN